MSPKFIIHSLILLPALAFSQAKTAGELRTDNLQKYTIESGEITYEITGDAKGDEVMIFDNHGWSSFRKQTMIFELYGISTIQTLLEINDGDYVYRLNPGDSTYFIKKDFKWSQQASYKSPEQASEAILFSLGGNLVADSVLLDRSCQVWTFEGNRALQELWVWNGLVLKRKTKLGDRIIYTTANKVEVNANPDNVLFRVPDYYTKKEDE